MTGFYLTALSSQSLAYAVRTSKDLEYNCNCKGVMHICKYAGAY